MTFCIFISTLVTSLTLPSWHFFFHPRDRGEDTYFFANPRDILPWPSWHNDYIPSWHEKQLPSWLYILTPLCTVIKWKSPFDVKFLIWRKILDLTSIIEPKTEFTEVKTRSRCRASTVVVTGGPYVSRFLEFFPIFDKFPCWWPRICQDCLLFAPITFVRPFLHQIVG